MSQILVVGSSNTDMVVKTRKLPAPGETVLGGMFLMNPGGKGANQAVGAVRLGGQVNDIFGNHHVAFSDNTNKPTAQNRYVIQNHPSG